jgi:hypothetical protein
MLANNTHTFADTLPVDLCFPGSLGAGGPVILV